MHDESFVHRGVIHGRTIELDSDVDLPQGQVVEVTLQPVANSERLSPGEGIRQSAGGWDDDPEGLQEFLEWNRAQRKVSRRESTS
ncbi:MAG: hypothetical protein WEH44_01300 [Pirellulaceae bacterium]